MISVVIHMYDFPFVNNLQNDSVYFVLRGAPQAI